MNLVGFRARRAPPEGGNSVGCHPGTHDGERIPGEGLAEVIRGVGGIPGFERVALIF